jgi:hypothetical protein
MRRARLEEKYEKYAIPLVKRAQYSCPHDSEDQYFRTSVRHVELLSRSTSHTTLFCLHPCQTYSSLYHFQKSQGFAVMIPRFMFLCQKNHFRVVMCPFPLLKEQQANFATPEFQKGRACLPRCEEPLSYT